jgi:hypothetical protein
MALRTPPSWLQNGSHPAENDRLTTQAIYATTGIIGATSMAITAQGTPNMTVNAAAGWVAIAGSTSNSGVYTAYNDATTVLTISTADATLPRIDRVVVTVSDSAYSGSTNTVAFVVVAGTPNASPVAPSTPSNSISLATISVAAGATSISSGNITDTRVATTSNAFVLSTGGTLTGALSGTSLTLSGALTGTSANLSGALSSTSTISTTSTITGKLTPTTGTTSISPLTFTSGTLLTTQTTGAVEMASNYFYATGTSTNGRGLIPIEHFYLNMSDVALANSTANQNLFPQSITLAVGYYYFEIQANLTTGNNSHNTAFGLGGTATYSSYIWNSLAAQGASGNTLSRWNNNTSNPYNLFQSGTTDTSTQIMVKGWFYVFTSGTVAPYIAFGSAPGGSTNAVTAPSFIKIIKTPINGVGKWA